MGGFDEKALGKRLQLARRRAGLTQQELCQKADLSYSTLAKIERGAIRSPSVFTVAAISSATGTSVEDILGIKESALKFPAPHEAKKTSKTGIKFIYFDVNGTLVRFYQKAFAEISRACGQPTDKIETVFWRHNDAICRGRITNEEFNNILAKELDFSGLDWRKYYMENIELTPGATDLVNWVTNHYFVGLLTNTMPGVTDALMQSKLIPDAHYTAIVDSSKVGAIKPDEKIYEIAQDLAGVKPNEILLVDDERPNLIAADQMSWQTLWFDVLDPEDSIRRAKEALEF
jgi:FMN phosphatase YigB (HAD superfamily)/DNA-binding XRE family transcriptional regulator